MPERYVFTLKPLFRRDSDFVVISDAEFTSEKDANNYFKNVLSKKLKLKYYICGLYKANVGAFRVDVEPISALSETEVIKRVKLFL